MRSSDKTDNVPKVTELRNIRRNSVSPLPTPRPFSLPSEFCSRPGHLLAEEGSFRKGKGDPQQNPGAPGSALDARQRARSAALRAWGPLRRPAMPACASEAGREAAALPAALRVPGRLTEPRARGGATRDWPRGVGGGPAAGRPGGRRQ